MDLKADTIPFHGAKSDSEIVIEIYVVTGKHSFFSIPESFCKECNMSYHAAKEAADHVDVEVDIRVKSYWTRFLRPLLKGGFHPPVIIVDDKLFSQGYDVPEVESLVDEIEN